MKPDVTAGAHPGTGNNDIPLTIETPRQQALNALAALPTNDLSVRDQAVADGWIRILAKQFGVRRGVTEADGLDVSEDGRTFAGEGVELDPAKLEPKEAVPGFPFLTPGVSALIAGEKGQGRSTMCIAGSVDAVDAGLRVAYLGDEVGKEQFDRRVTEVVGLREYELTDELKTTYHERFRYLSIGEYLPVAFTKKGTERWITEVSENYDIVIFDPLSSVGAALRLNFQSDNPEYEKFFVNLVQPLCNHGVTVVLLDNVPYSDRTRSVGASAKENKARLTFYCEASKTKSGLIIVAEKTNRDYVSHSKGDKWVCWETELLITRYTGHNRAPLDADEREVCQQISDLMEKFQTHTMSASEITGGTGGRASRVVAMRKLLIEWGCIEQTQKGAVGQPALFRFVRRFSESDGQ